MQVWLKRGEHWAYLEQWESKRLMDKEPYYIVRGNDVIFFNTRPSDYYSIEVWR